MRNLQDISIQYMKGVGPARKKLFENLGVETIEDLLYFFPRRYEDRTQMTPIAQLKVGELQTVAGQVLEREGRRAWYTHKHVFEAEVGDEKSKVRCVWFNQPYLDSYLKPGSQVVLYGKVDLYKNRLQMISPEYEIISAGDETLSIGRIVPIYSLTRGISQRYLRKIIRLCLDKFSGEAKDFLPYSIREKYKLLNLAQSVGNIHFPESFEVQQKAHERIAFEEFFFFQVSVIMRRRSMAHKDGIAHRIEPAFLDHFVEAFPFELTGAQIRVIKEIAADMSRAAPMLRLLQGDVGSGKTLVAFFGCVAAQANGYQSAVMAPTEILARQHFENIQKMIRFCKFKDMKMALLVSGLKKPEKDRMLAAIKSGEVDLVIGTHALIQEDVGFKNLSFAVIDEQHKFGVRQRALLSAKGTNPDVLIMTATPIPRTLCLTLYGDLDISVIDEMPPGRGKTKTKFFPQQKAADAYKLVSDLVKMGRQVYIVYPIIEESEVLDLKAAEKMYKHFKEHEFKSFRLGLIHGRLNKKDSETVMEQFKKGEIDILVSTTVLEVGVDIANANVMVIEHAERFGLAQLHQLRGRIGRGMVEGWCLLIGDPNTPGAKLRMEAVLATTDGFKIAEQDLLIRGPGEFFGRHQHGLNELKVANPLTEIHLLELARREATELINSDPRLQSGTNRVIKEIIHKRYPAYMANVQAG